MENLQQFWKNAWPWLAALFPLGLIGVLAWLGYVTVHGSDSPPADRGRARRKITLWLLAFASVFLVLYFFTVAYLIGYPSGTDATQQFGASLLGGAVLGLLLILVEINMGRRLQQDRVIQEQRASAEHRSFLSHISERELLRIDYEQTRRDLDEIVAAAAVLQLAAHTLGRRLVGSGAWGWWAKLAHPPVLGSGILEQDEVFSGESNWPIRIVRGGSYSGVHLEHPSFEAAHVVSPEDEERITSGSPVSVEAWWATARAIEDATSAALAAMSPGSRGGGFHWPSGSPGEPVSTALDRLVGFMPARTSEWDVRGAVELRGETRIDSRVVAAMGLDASQRADTLLSDLEQRAAFVRQVQSEAGLLVAALHATPAVATPDMIGGAAIRVLGAFRQWLRALQELLAWVHAVTADAAHIADFDLSGDLEWVPRTQWPTGGSLAQRAVRLFELRREIETLEEEVDR